MRPMATLALAVTCVGIILVTAGIALIYVPAAFIAAGAALAAVGLFAIDVDRTPPEDES